MRVVRATDPGRRADAFAVRRQVFVDEQGIAADLEYDDHDDRATTVHFVAYDGDDPVGAARLRPHGEVPATGKVERVAVCADRRGGGWGRRLMVAVHDAARDRGFTELRLHAQVTAAGFYEALGYAVTSDEPFEEAGRPHVAMRRALDG